MPLSGRKGALAARVNSKTVLKDSRQLAKKFSKVASRPEMLDENLRGVSDREWGEINGDGRTQSGC